MEFVERLSKGSGRLAYEEVLHTSFTVLNTDKRTVHLSDASTVAIGAVAYLRAADTEGQYRVGFVMGKSKLAPHPAHTFRCLELCAVMLAVELYELISDEMDIEIATVKFFTDSKIVLGYIHNSTRFYLYVSNRVTRIRRSTHPNQWYYVLIDLHPADYATRFMPACQLRHSSWLSGPAFLYQDNAEEISKSNIFALIKPEADDEIRPEATTLATKASESQLGSQHFERCSSWRTLYHTIAKLIHIAASFKGKSDRAEKKGWKCFGDASSICKLWKAKVVIICSVQHSAFKEELKCLEGRQAFLKQSTLKKLNPIVDEDGLLRVGGRLSRADLKKEEKHPLIIPHTHHIATLLVRNFHKQVAHQGQHITEGAIRSAGY